MNSLILLRSLFRSIPEHPLFWRRYFYGRRVRVKPSRPFYLRVFRGLGIGVLALSLIFLPFFIIVTFPYTGLAMIGIITGATIMGAHVAVHLAQRIRHEHDDRRFDVISTSTGGAIGLCWAMAARYIQINNTARQLHRLFFTIDALLAGAAVLVAVIVVLLSGLTFSMITDAMGFSAMGRTTASQEVTVITTMLGVLMLVVFIVLDSLQSIVMGVLIGCLVPHFSRARTDAGVTAFGVFLAVQIALYVLMIYAAIVLPSLILDALNLHVGIIISLIHITIAVLIREAFIVWLWRVVCRWLNTDLEELRVLSNVQ